MSGALDTARRVCAAHRQLVGVHVTAYELRQAAQAQLTIAQAQEVFDLYDLAREVGPIYLEVDRAKQFGLL